MKKSRVRKTSTDTIDAQSIARYLMVTETKDSYEFPEELKSLREFITAYDIITSKIRTKKNNIIRAMDVLFRGLSNIIDLDENTIRMLEKFRTPDEFLIAGRDGLIPYVTSKKADLILKAAGSSLSSRSNSNALKIETESLIRILKVLNEEEDRIETSMTNEQAVHDHVITSIPGIGPVTGSIIIGKIGNIERLESAEKLVAFAGIDPVIKESGKRRSERSISKRGDPLLRYAIYLSALSANKIKSRDIRVLSSQDGWRNAKAESTRGYTKEAVPHNMVGLAQ